MPTVTIPGATLSKVSAHLEERFFRTLGIVGAVKSELDYGERLAIGRDGNWWAWTIEIFRQPLSVGYEIRERIGTAENKLGVIRVDELFTDGVVVHYQENAAGSFADSLTTWLGAQLVPSQDDGVAEAQTNKAKKMLPKMNAGPFRMQVRLSQDEWLALRGMAELENRHPIDQAHYLIRKALGL